MKHLLVCAGVLACTGVSAHGSAAPADDRAAEVLVMARAALGGAKLDGIAGLSASGNFRRLMGDREIEGELTVELAPPGRIRRTEHVGAPGGPSFTRVTALNDGEFWSDGTNRGGGGFVARLGGAGEARPPSEADRERFQQMQQRRLQNELNRFLLVWLLRSDTPVTHAGRAEAEDGSADVLEVRRDGASPVRLFLDSATHLPVMLTYEDAQPRMMGRRGRTGPPDPEEIRRRMAEPPRQAAFELRFDDYRSVDGVKLPHRLTQSVDGTPTEEWTIDRYTVNPRFKSNTFSKP
jgi:hypothetical protein